MSRKLFKCRYKYSEIDQFIQKLSCCCWWSHALYNIFFYYNWVQLQLYFFLHIQCSVFTQKCWMSMHYKIINIIISLRHCCCCYRTHCRCCCNTLLINFHYVVCIITEYAHSICSKSSYHYNIVSMCLSLFHLLSLIHFYFVLNCSFF